MPVINGKTLLAKSPIRGMFAHKLTDHGVSYGLGEAGYDIRLRQEVVFKPGGIAGPHVIVDGGELEWGRFVIASAIEEFDMPADLVGIVHDKSTWARQGLSVFNTVIEPGWKGFLTLELVFHGYKEITIPAGAGIAQVIFSSLAHDARYEGKYQDQKDEPVPSRFTNA